MSDTIDYALTKRNENMHGMKLREMEVVRFSNPTLQRRV